MDLLIYEIVNYIINYYNYYYLTKPKQLIFFVNSIS